MLCFYPDHGVVGFVSPYVSQVDFTSYRDESDKIAKLARILDRLPLDGDDYVAFC